MSIITLESLPPNLSGITEKWAGATDLKIFAVLSHMGVIIVEYLKSLTTEVRPPARKGGSSRQAHPGHWADVSGDLASKYAFAVERSGDGGWELRISNSSEHAVYVEAMDGFFVLTGIGEPGGPVEVALRQALPVIAPGWTVRG